jgi:hypothetical protein
MPQSSEPAATENQTASELQQPSRSPLFSPVVAMAIVYCGSLIGLAFFTSNQDVLNPVQIRESSLIVSGILDSSGKQGVTITIEQVWKGRAETKNVFVRGLSASHLKGSDIWIVPLKRASRTEYMVTPLKNSSPDSPKKLIYPANPETRNKLKSLLSPDAPAP